MCGAKRMVGKKSGDLSVGPNCERETIQGMKHHENNVTPVWKPFWLQMHQHGANLESGTCEVAIGTILTRDDHGLDVDVSNKTG